LTFASFAVGRIGDVVYKRYKTKHNGENPPPERRLDIQVYAYATTAAGKIMFGWFVLKHFHPAAGLVAAALGKSLYAILYYTLTDSSFHSRVRNRRYHGIQHKLSNRVYAHLYCRPYCSFQLIEKYRSGNRCSHYGLDTQRHGLWMVFYRISIHRWCLHRRLTVYTPSWTCLSRGACYIF
jgi:hypothetical protein